MAKAPSTHDRWEFEAFCDNATDSQLREILKKERAANRFTYANIARKKLEARGLKE